MSAFGPNNGYTYNIYVAAIAPTDKQLFAIRVIESNLPPLRFRGKTKWEASQFIGEHMEKSKLASETRKVRRQMAEGDSVTLSNEVALQVYGRKLIGAGHEKILEMPDMSIAYSSDNET